VQWLNYHHLFLFWVVAREGSITRATQSLRLAEPTISGQIRCLEGTLGEKLFERSGHRLVLTESGSLAYGYADEIFSLGFEFLEALKSRPGARPARLHVGIADVQPKAIVRGLLQPVLQADIPVRLVSREESSIEDFVEQLVVNALDLVLAEAPASPGRARLSNRWLGECGTTVFGTAALARARRKRFPRSLEGAPFLLVGPRSARRGSLEQWFDQHAVRPRIVAEVDDSSLNMELGREGEGLFIGPSMLESEICGCYEVQVVAQLPDVRQQFYTISAEPPVERPAVTAICEAMRERLLAGRVPEKARRPRP
jgi:LysR family transcriptional regulator, transcriptional activator of nhaA